MGSFLEVMTDTNEKAYLNLAAVAFVRVITDTRAKVETIGGGEGLWVVGESVAQLVKVIRGVGSA